MMELIQIIARSSALAPFNLVSFASYFQLTVEGS
jgi:hypothetical protein